MSRFSFSNNPIADVPAILRRHWFNIKGPLKWMVVGAVVALVGVLTCVPTRQ